jgi:hypothetical protein
MRQLLYISSARSFITSEEMSRILTVSRRNNQRDRLSGLLWSDGTRFLQVLEGRDDIVERTVARIRGDERHRAIVILHDREVERPTFAAWSMAVLNDGDESLKTALAGADPTVRGTFEGLANSRRAA